MNNPARCRSCTETHQCRSCQRRRTGGLTADQIATTREATDFITQTVVTSAVINSASSCDSSSSSSSDTGSSCGGDF